MMCGLRCSVCGFGVGVAVGVGVGVGVGVVADITLCLWRSSP